MAVNLWTDLFQVDAIVSSAVTELRLHHGTASTSLVEKGVETLQEGCDTKAVEGT